MARRRRRLCRLSLLTLTPSPFVFLPPPPQFVVSGAAFDMNFLLLTIQSAVCVGAVYAARAMGVFTFRDFNMPDAKAWFPVSALLVAVIYSGSKSLQNLPIPAYTVLKNGAIILTAYGELVVFKSPLSRLTLVAFGLMIVSSLIAAWPELSKTLAGTCVAPPRFCGAQPSCFREPARSPSPPPILPPSLER
jgi:multidrug transporter EmrE-like cation transporter